MHKASFVFLVHFFVNKLDFKPYNSAATSFLCCFPPRLFSFVQLPTSNNDRQQTNVALL